jgi:hypothetical protein
VEQGELMAVLALYLADGPSEETIFAAATGFVAE